MSKATSASALPDSIRSRIVGEGFEAPDQLLANPGNWRVHPKHQADALEDLLKQVGWVQRVIVNTTTQHIVDGHLRVQVAMRRQEAQVPVLYVKLTEEEERLVLAALDPIGGLAGTDQTVLDELLKGIQADGDGLAALLDSLRSPEASTDEEKGLTDDDDVPIPSEEPTPRTGDIWIMGRHRLMVGDSSSPHDVGLLMAGEQADMVWIDPPYNVAIENSAGKKIKNDDMDDASFIRMLQDWLGCAYTVTKEGGPIYVAHADSNGHHFRNATLKAGWALKQALVWVKSSITLGRQDYQWQHEPILYGWKPGAAHCWYGDRNKATVIDDDVDLKKLGKPELMAIINDMRNAGATTVVRYAKPTKCDLHPTMKPVSLVKQQVRNSSRRGERVLDLFGGSGTTLIACEAIGRQARLMEIDPVYADVIIRRWEAWTGAKAVREEDGLTMEQAADPNHGAGAPAGEQ